MQHRDFLKSANKSAVLTCLLAFAIFLAGSLHAGAQASGSQGAGFAPSESQVRLAGNTPAKVLNGEAIRVGHYNPEQMLRLAIFVTPRDLAGQEKLILEQQTKGSPNFHKFLTAEEWNARFAPTAENERAVVDWANSQGLTVTNRFANRMLVDVEAPSGVIEKALSVTINEYQVGDEVDFSNDQEPSIPSRLSGIIGGIFGLQSIERVKPVGRPEKTTQYADYLPGPVYREAGSSRGEGDPTKAPWAQAATAASGPGADHGPSQPVSDAGQSTPNPPDEIGTMDPANLYSSEGYSLSALYAQSKCCNVHNDSNGSPADTSIALVTFANYQQSDVNTFFKYYGLAWNTTAFEIDGDPTKTTKCTVGTSGCGGLGADDEADLDVEWSTAFSNSFGSSNDTAHVYVYESGLGYYNNWFDVWNYVLTDGLAHVASTSWAWTEENQQSGDPGWMTGTAEGDAHYIFNALVAQGNTLIAAAGDQGPTSGCTEADQVFWPANDPDFLAAGGTSLDFNYDGTFSSETAWVGGSTLKDCQSNGGGGGGGVSKYFSAPSWQSGLKYEEWSGGKQYIVSGQTNRMMPDMSLNATGDFQWYYCTDPACPKVTAANGWHGVGGTSIVAPELAGFFAQVNSYLNSIGHICGSSGTDRCEPIGNPDPILYYEGKGQGAPHYPFYDTTQDCVTNYLTANDISLTYFCAEPGYDLATGWGSANLLQLAWTYNFYIIPSDGVPSVHFTGPATSKWYNTDQEISWTVSDGVTSGTAGLPPPGVAGFTQGWDSIPADPYSEAHGGSGNSFYSGPQYPYGKSGCLSFNGLNGCSSYHVGQGCHTVNVEAWDNQGFHTGARTYGPICYDTVAPTVSAVYNPSSPAATGWYTGPVTITLTASDPGGSGASGVSHIYYGLGNSACKTSSPASCSVYGSAFKLSTQEVVTLTAFSQDKAGNFSSVISKTIKIDSTPPSTTAGFTGVLSSGNWTNAVTITLKAADNLSGVAATYYTLDGGSRITYSAPFKVSTVGNHTLDFWSVDKAGNTEKTNVDAFHIVSATTATLTASPNPSKNGQTVTLKVTVTATDPGTPTGTATFLMRSTKLATVALSGGVASLTTSALPLGSDTLAATFNSGTANYLSSTSASVIQVVHEATTTSLTAAPNPAVYGKLVTFTAKVKPSISGTPTGSVDFLDGATVLASVTLSGSDVATLTTSALAGGGHSITAVYLGDKTYATSTSNAVTETIAKAATVTALKTSTRTSAYDEIVTLTATMTSTAGTPTGTVTFASNGIGIGTVTLGAGVASLGTKALPVGTDSVTASYNGSADFNTSASSAINIVIDPSQTTTKLASSLNPSTVGAAVTFTATVTSPPGPAPGTVTFKDGTTPLGTATLSGAKATLTTTKLTQGTHTVTAVYAGNTDYATSTSADLTQTVNAAAVASRVVYVPDYYGQFLQVRVGTGATPTAITIDLPSCNPNSVAVNSNKAYVVCSLNGSNPDKILVYNAATIRSAAAGTLSISPLQTITSSQFKSLIGITFDASNNLWVASYGNNQVDEITAAALATTAPTVTASLVDSPSSPVALAFDKNGSLWVSGDYDGGILLNFPATQLGQGMNANPDYCMATTNVGAGCQYVDGVFLSPEGLALFNGDVWVANNSTGNSGNVPGRELVDLKYSGGSATAMGTLTVNAIFGKSGVAADSPFVCPGGLFAGSVHLWVNDESYGETNPQCGAGGDVASKTGGVFDFTAAQLAAQTTAITQVLGYANITGRPGFGGIFVENDQ